MKKVMLAVMGFYALSCTHCSRDSSDAEQDTFIRVYGGKPYKGESKGEFYVDGVKKQSWKGSATLALIEAEGDSVSLFLGADFGNQSEVNLKVRGKQEGTNYARMKGHTDQFTIKGDQINGHFENPDQLMRFNGKLKPGQTTVTVQIRFLRTSGVFPAGSELMLSFDASRKVEQSGENDSGCQMRMVPIWSPNGMTMGMVPDC